MRARTHTQTSTLSTHTHNHTHAHPFSPSFPLPPSLSPILPLSFGRALSLFRLLSLALSCSLLLSVARARSFSPHRSPSPSLTRTLSLARSCACVLARVHACLLVCLLVLFRSRFLACLLSISLPHILSLTHTNTLFFLRILLIQFYTSICTPHHTRVYTTDWRVAWCLHRRAFGRWFRYQNLIEIEKQRDLDREGEREREFDSLYFLSVGNNIVAGSLRCWFNGSPKTHEGEIGEYSWNRTFIRKNVIYLVQIY